uniref:Uncharacterized protein n=1 Tax=Rhizophora mucronata TaxID=61149 RepID=A0A2P2M0L2_RHIMU
MLWLKTLLLLGTFPIFLIYT